MGVRKGDTALRAHLNEVIQGDAIEIQNILQQMGFPRFTDATPAYLGFARVLDAGVTPCEREKRDLRPSPTRLAIYGDAAKESTLRPGGPILPAATVMNPYNGSAYDISEGQRLFDWYNRPVVTRTAAAASGRH